MERRNYFQMELVEIRKKANHQAEIVLDFADTVKKYEFSYTDGDVFSVDFPEELRKLLRLLPSTVSHSMIEKIENFLTSNTVNFPFEMEIEKEILQMV